MKRSLVRTALQHATVNLVCAKRVFLAMGAVCARLGTLGTSVTKSILPAKPWTVERTRTAGTSQTGARPVNVCPAMRGTAPPALARTPASHPPVHHSLFAVTLGQANQLVPANLATKEMARCAFPSTPAPCRTGAARATQPHVFMKLQASPSVIVDFT